MEYFDVLKIRLEGLKNELLDKRDDIREKVMLSLDMIPFTEIYGDHDRLYIDNIALKNMSNMLFFEIADYVREEDIEGMLVYLQKKYSRNYDFRCISVGYVSHFTQPIFVTL